MEEVKEKKCEACGEIKPIDEFSFDNKGRRLIRCKSCVKNKIQTPEVAKRRMLNEQGLNECKYCGAIKPIEEFAKESRNISGRSSMCKQCNINFCAEDRRKNSSLRNKRVREKRLANPEHFREVERAWYNANKEKGRQHAKNWRARHKEHKAYQDRNRRARKKGAEGKHTKEEIRELRIKQDNKCVYCGADLAEGMHVDHIMPLVLGGTNYIDNIQLLCPHCNLSKNAKHPDVYEAEIGFIRNKESIDGGTEN